MDGDRAMAEFRKADGVQQQDSKVRSMHHASCVMARVCEEGLVPGVTVIAREVSSLYRDKWGDG